MLQVQQCGAQNSVAHAGNTTEEPETHDGNTTEEPETRACAMQRMITSTMLTPHNACES